MSIEVDSATFEPIDMPKRFQTKGRLDMSIHYTGRTDFRAFAVLVDAIDGATKADLQKAVRTCVEVANNPVYDSAKQIIWKNMATLLRKQIRRY